MHFIFEFRKLNLPTQKAFDYKYGMGDNWIRLNVPIKKDGVVFSTLSNLDLVIKIKDIATMEIEHIYIDRDSVYKLIKNVQGRTWPISYFFI